jgi:uncharacterized ubiquitin-like protein YukD
MVQVIVTVKKEGESARDLEVPAEMPSGELADLITKALGWQSENTSGEPNYRLAVNPPGRVLVTDESLADVEAWDGAQITVLPPGIKYQAPNGDSSSNEDGPPGRRMD